MLERLGVCFWEHEFEFGAAPSPRPPRTAQSPTQPALPQPVGVCGRCMYTAAADARVQP